MFQAYTMPPDSPTCDFSIIKKYHNQPLLICFTPYLFDFFQKYEQKLICSVLGLFYNMLILNKNIWNVCSFVTGDL